MTPEGKKKIALSACSDPVTGEREREVYSLAGILETEGTEVVINPHFFGRDDLAPPEKAKMLMDFFSDPQMDYIFDISGGDIANLVLPYLDFEVIRRSRALFFGYSDLTTVLNAIVACTGKATVNYQILHVLRDHGPEELEYLREFILKDRIAETDLGFSFLRGSSMEGRILGGNIRCFLKLAGTGYFPDMKDGILLIESLGGGVYQLMTALEQYRQMGVFDKVNGVILGTFSKMEKEQLSPSARELALGIIPGNIPVAKTRYIGHYTDARAILTGQKYHIRSGGQ